MTTIKLTDGTEHQVTQTWFDECGYLAGEDEPRRLSLLKLSETRPLSKIEEAEVQALTKWKNVNKAWNWLQGRHYSEFGFTALDQVHGNSQHKTCGCITQTVFDHNKVMIGDPVEQHVHTPWKICDKHMHLAGDIQAHFDAVKG